MTSYLEQYAEVYDILYKDKPYQEEADFIDTCFKKYNNGQNKRILELACGTGEHAMRLESLGYDVVAVDYSHDMLARAKQKASKRNSGIQFYHQDMCSLDIPGETFDAAICLFDSIGYVVTNQNLNRVFENVHGHLRPKGLFIFEFWNAGAMLRHYDPVRVFRCRVENREILRISETKLDYMSQTGIVTYNLFELYDDHTYRHFEETHTDRFFLVQEMAAFLEASDFTPVGWFAGFSNHTDITSDTWHVVSIARKN